MSAVAKKIVSSRRRRWVWVLVRPWTTAIISRWALLTWCAAFIAPRALSSTGRMPPDTNGLDRFAAEVWLRELFSPSFIVFLLELAPKGFAFEYVEGTLC